MFARLAEHAGNQVRRAVDDEMLLDKVGRRGDESVQLYDAPDAAEVAAERSFCLGEDVDGAELGAALAARNVDRFAEMAGYGDFAAVDVLYVSIEALFQANKEPRTVVLGQEFHIMFKGDLSVHAYAQKLSACWAH
jgi:hypothetical protein